MKNVYIYIVSLLAVAVITLIFIKLSTIGDTIADVTKVLDQKITTSVSALSKEIKTLNDDVSSLQEDMEDVDGDNDDGDDASEVKHIEARSVPQGRQEITDDMTVGEIAAAMKHNQKHGLTLAAHSAHKRAYRRCMSKTIKAIRKEINSRSGLGRWTIAPLVDNTDCNGLVLKPKVASEDQKEQMVSLVSEVWVDLGDRYTLEASEDLSKLKSIIIERFTDEEWAEVRFEAKKAKKLAKLKAKKLKAKVKLAKKLLKLEDAQNELEKSNFKSYQKAKTKAKAKAKARAKARAQVRLKRKVQLQAAALRALERKIDVLEQVNSVEEITLETDD